MERGKEIIGRLQQPIVNSIYDTHEYVDRTGSRIPLQQNHFSQLSVQPVVDLRQAYTSWEPKS
jgi:hypothetical protein